MKNIQTKEQLKPNKLINFLTVERVAIKPLNIYKPIEENIYYTIGGSKNIVQLDPVFWGFFMMLLKEPVEGIYLKYLLSWMKVDYHTFESDFIEKEIYLKEDQLDFYLPIIRKDFSKYIKETKTFIPKTI